VRWLAAAVLLVGCGAPGVDLATRQPVDPPLPSLPIQGDVPRQEGRWVIRIVEGHLVDLEDRIALLPAGEHSFLVTNDVEGATVDEHGRDLRSDAVALWIRGRGSAVHRLPQAARGPINGGVQEDWDVVLEPGVYVIGETIGKASEGYLVVR
jgi:hypothetical protein